EAPVSTKEPYDAVNSLFHGVLNHTPKPFGGKATVFSGDFRQSLPILKRGSPEQAVLP
ncbi:hypothetical protein DFQ27_001166, partial [Actinomortierella ambigua]